MVRPHGSFRALHFLASGVLALVCAGAAHAQDAPAPDAQAPAHISLVDGVAILERDGQTDDAPGNMPLLAGDRVRTRGGRVEILFADGSTLHLDHHTAIDLQSDELVRLLEGRIRLSIPGPERTIAYRIDGQHGWAHIAEPGEYRVALLNGPQGLELELAVLRGRAELANEGGQTELRAGERAFARAGAAPSYAYVANSAALDAFDRWSEARRDERMAASTEYLPDEVRPYAASLERHGYWRTEPTYGRVWYPRVAPDWRPYYRGRWVSLRPYGWTWVAYDPWGWPTHHYGRWGFSSAGAWFWIPGRTWGAAWVSWAYAPGYVSWCPLGWNNRPIFQININVGRRYDPWRAWTVVPVRHFGRGFVHRTVVRASYLDHGTRAAFVHRDRAPDIRGYAVPRGTPIRVAGSGASRRGAPLYTNLPAGQGRIRTDGARIDVADGARRSPATGAAASGGARERAVPSRPAVRSDRSIETGARRAPGTADTRRAPAAQTARPPAGQDLRRVPADTSQRTPAAQGTRPAPAYSGARRAPADSGVRRAPSDSGVRRPPTDSGVRRAPADSGVRRPPAVRSPEPPRNNAPRPGGGADPAGARRRVTAPRAEAPSSAPASAPRMNVPPARPRAPGAPAARTPSAPARMDAPPSSRRPAARPQSRPEYRGAPTPSPDPRPRAVPRSGGGRPGGDSRPSPQVQRRGPDRAPSGSYERRGPASAQPPAASGSGGRSRSASPPRGARPRGGQ